MVAMFNFSIKMCKLSNMKILLIIYLQININIRVKKNNFRNKRNNSIISLKIKNNLISKIKIKKKIFSHYQYQKTVFKTLKKSYIYLIVLYKRILKIL
jgi:hypothetical protein